MYVSISNTASSVYNTGSQACLDFYHNFTCIKDDPVSLRYFWETVSNAFICMSDSRSELLSTPIGKTIAVVDFVQILIDINDYFSGKFDNIDWSSTAQRVYMMGRAFFAISNVTFTLAFLMDIGMITASAAVASSMGTICAVTAALGFGVAAGAAAWRWYNAEGEHTNLIKKEAAFGLVGCTAAASLPTLTTLGITLAPIPLASLAITASTCIIYSMVLQSNHKKELGSMLGKPKEETTRRVTVLTGLAQIVEDSESLEKLCKLAHKLLSLVKDAASLALAGFAKAFADFHEAALLPKRFKEWFCRDAKGERFWEKSATTGWKIGNKFFQTSLAACHLINFVIKFKIAEFAILASASIGGIPLMVAATLASVTLFSFCGLVDNALLYAGKAGQDYEKAAKKQKKWQIIVDDINAQNSADVVNYDRKKRGKKFEVSHGIKEKTAIMNLSNTEYAKRRLSQYNVKVENAEIVCNKALINIFNDTAKTVGCSLALAGLGLAASTTASPAVVEAVEAGAFGFGITSAFTGVWKPWNEKKYPELRPVPTLLVAAAAA